MSRFLWSRPDLPNVTLKVKRPMHRGANVLRVQRALVSLGYPPDKKANQRGADGWYGTKTANAIRRFQRDHGLKVDGIYGPATRAAMLRGVQSLQFA
ncbi:peptidoglycan-binding domain-containing protein [Shouchella lonarensis]|uniref:Peptidoglycan binding domain-containing protein n=1 Tax=Shouchella lonarensis TaxID=1464122 RepID=A0A1G6HPD2_9BACI|nr:peptidoglycan-binding domain-containing protein [Shouchella lonarensis]SDB96129.1 Putative peptidoglycan binding domain-containing protein [Shouchella lonarensis]